MAVRRGKPSIVKLLLDHGAQVAWMSFGEVVCWPKPEVLRIFIERGADTHTGYPVAAALKRSPKAFLGVYKSYINRYPGWQFQADMALRHFCHEGSLRGVCLLLWLGANPRAKVPRHQNENEEMWESSLWEAAISGRAEILKKIGPQKGLDDLDNLLQLASGSSNAASIEYLIGLGADPNVVADNGETALRAALWSLESALDWKKREGYSADNAVEALKTLLNLGARFQPDNSDELQFLRHCLLKLDWWQAYELIKHIHAAEALGVKSTGRSF
jgi:hypothetical protein